MPVAPPTGIRPDAARHGWTANQKAVNRDADDGAILKVKTAKPPAMLKTVVMTMVIAIAISEDHAQALERVLLA